MRKSTDNGVDFEMEEFLRLRQLRIEAENAEWNRVMDLNNKGLLPKIDNSDIDLDENRIEIKKSKEKFKNQQRIQAEYKYLNGRI